VPQNQAKKKRGSICGSMWSLCVCVCVCGCKKSETNPPHRTRKDIHSSSPKRWMLLDTTFSQIEQVRPPSIFVHGDVLWSRKAGLKNENVECWFDIQDVSSNKGVTVGLSKQSRFLFYPYSSQAERIEQPNFNQRFWYSWMCFRQ